MSEYILAIHKIQKPEMGQKTYNLKPPKEGYVLMHVQAEDGHLYLVWHELDWPEENDDTWGGS